MKAFSLQRFSLFHLLSLALGIGSLFLVSCVEPVGEGGALEAASRAASPAAVSPEESRTLDKHDVALRFLTAYIRLDRNLALQYATPEAVSSLDWNRPHGTNVPYYDDKMILHYNGGWARVYFQQIGGGYRISKIEAHDR